MQVKPGTKIKLPAVEYGMYESLWWNDGNRECQFNSEVTIYSNTDFKLCGKPKYYSINVHYDKKRCYHESIDMNTDELKLTVDGYNEFFESARKDKLDGEELRIIEVTAQSVVLSVKGCKKDDHIYVHKFKNFKKYKSAYLSQRIKPEVFKEKEAKYLKHKRKINSKISLSVASSLLSSIVLTLYILIGLTNTIPAPFGMPPLPLGILSVVLEIACWIPTYLVLSQDDIPLSNALELFLSILQGYTFTVGLVAVEFFLYVNFTWAKDVGFLITASGLSFIILTFIGILVSTIAEEVFNYSNHKAGEPNPTELTCIGIAALELYGGFIGGFFDNRLFWLPLGVMIFLGAGLGVTKIIEFIS